MTLIILLWQWGLKALAQPENAVVLTDEQEQYPLGLHIELLEDKDQEWTIDDVTSPEIASLFVPSQEAAPGFGFSDSSIRAYVNSRVWKKVRWLLTSSCLGFRLESNLVNQPNAPKRTP